MKQIPVKLVIKFEDLEKLDTSVGMVEKVEYIEHSDNLVCLKIEFGEYLLDD